MNDEKTAVKPKDFVYDGSKKGRWERSCRKGHAVRGLRRTDAQNNS